MQAVALRADAWEPLMRSKRLGRLLLPILALCADEDGECVLGLEPGEEDRVMAEVAELIPACVIEIAAYWRKRWPTPLRAQGSPSRCPSKLISPATTTHAHVAPGASLRPAADACTKLPRRLGVIRLQNRRAAFAHDYVIRARIPRPRSSRDKPGLSNKFRETIAPIDRAFVRLSRPQCDGPEVWWPPQTRYSAPGSRRAQWACLARPSGCPRAETHAQARAQTGSSPVGKGPQQAVAPSPGRRPACADRPRPEVSQLVHTTPRTCDGIDKEVGAKREQTG